MRPLSRLIREGAWLVLAARNVEKLEEVKQACEKLGGRALVQPCDVTNEAQVPGLF